MSALMLAKRAFSSSALLGQLVRPPIQVYGVEGNYASALYSSAFKEKSLDQADKDLQQIKELYNTNADFKVSISLLLIIYTSAIVKLAI